MAKRAPLTLRCGEQSTPITVARRIATSLRENIACTLAATDATGAVIAQLSATYSTPTVAVAAVQPAAVPELASSRPRRWPGYLVGALAVAAAAVAAGLAVSSWHDYSKVGPMTPAAETTALDQRSRSKAAAAYGTGAGALLCAALTLVIVLRF